jgi:NADH-quinone oxidoreductase subunit M
MIAEYGGVATPMPNYSTIFVVVSLSSLGLPLLNGFVGELLILVGTFASTVPYAKVFTVLGATGVILSAVYLLWMLQRVVFGEITKDENAKLEDLDGREYAGLLPLVALAVIMGVLPMLFMNQTKATVNAIRAHVEGKALRASK